MNPFKKLPSRKDKPLMNVATPVSAQWKDFINSIFDPGQTPKPGSYQYNEMKKCFYAGFLCAFNQVQDIACATDDNDVSEGHGVASLESIKAELEDYAKSVTREAG